MIKLCVFDLDGTVMDTLDSIAYFVNSTLKRMGLDKIDTEKFKYFAGDGRAALIHRSLEFAGADSEDNFKIATKYYDEAYEGNFMYLSKPFDGIREELEKLKKAGIIITVLSNKPHNVAKDNVPKKPDPAGFIYIAEKFGVSCEECMMVGDTNVDMLTGLNANAHSLGVLWGFRPREELEENGAHVIVQKVDELADAIISF